MTFPLARHGAFRLATGFRKTCSAMSPDRPALKYDGSGRPTGEALKAPTDRQAQASRDGRAERVQPRSPGACEPPLRALLLRPRAPRPPPAAEVEGRNEHRGERGLLVLALPRPLPLPRRIRLGRMDRLTAHPAREQRAISPPVRSRWASDTCRCWWRRSSSGGL